MIIILNPGLLDETAIVVNAKSSYPRKGVPFAFKKSQVRETKVAGIAAFDQEVTVERDGSSVQYQAAGQLLTVQTFFVNGFRTH